MLNASHRHHLPSSNCSGPNKCLEGFISSAQYLTRGHNHKRVLLACEVLFTETFWGQIIVKFTNKTNKTAQLVGENNWPPLWGGSYCWSEWQIKRSASLSIVLCENVFWNNYGLLDLFQWQNHIFNCHVCLALNIVKETISCIFAF